MSASDSGTAADTPAFDAELSAKALALASAIEAAMAEGRTVEALSPEAVQALMSCACKVYAANVDAGYVYDAFGMRSPLSATDVMVTASGLLKAANLAAFELGMWQSWTGR